MDIAVAKKQWTVFGVDWDIDCCGIVVFSSLDIDKSAVEAVGFDIDACSVKSMIGIQKIGYTVGQVWRRGSGMN